MRVATIEDNQRAKILKVVEERTGFYRANPHRFVKDFLGVSLKPFQMILLYMMNISTHFMYLASRGQLAFLYRNIQVIKKGKIGEG